MDSVHIHIRTVFFIKAHLPTGMLCGGDWENWVAQRKLIPYCAAPLYYCHNKKHTEALVDHALLGTVYLASR